MCYWPGGGKEGQFSPGFGKRGRFKGSAANTRQEALKPSPTANITSISEENKQIFACMPMGDSEFKVFATSDINETCKPDDKVSPSSSVIDQQNHNTMGVESLSDASREVPLVCHMKALNKTVVPTLLDSGTSNHCFANLSLFTSYTPFERPLSGLTAKEGLTFDMVGRGNVKLQTNVNRQRRTITLDNALYTPGFRSNLILVAKLSTKGAEACFKDNKAVIRTKDGVDIISTTHSDLLYVVDMDKIQPTAFTTQSKQKPTSFATWHRCLAHAGAETICQMMTENLVDGLDISGELSISGLCKDCIYGKHTAHPYNNSKSREKEVLEWVYVDIWGPSQVQSAGGALYFIVI